MTESRIIEGLREREEEREIEGGGGGEGESTRRLERGGGDEEAVRFDGDSSALEFLLLIILPWTFYDFASSSTSPLATLLARVCLPCSL